MSRITLAALLALGATAIMAAQCGAPNADRKAQCEADGGSYVKTKSGDGLNIWECVK